MKTFVPDPSLERESLGSIRDPSSTWSEATVVILAQPA